MGDRGRGEGRRGFSLVEMLVVLAILAILSALLFPVFARAKARARQSACGANLSGIGRALALYRIDHDDRLSEWEAGEGFPFVSRLPAIVGPYGVRGASLVCPDDRYAPVPDVSADGTYAGRTGTSYAYNRRLVVEAREPGVDPARTLISWEFIPFHGPSLPNGAINGVALDGHLARVPWDRRLDWISP